jgi:hypothetical protein
LELLNDIVAWVRVNMDVLQKLGAAIVVVGGAIWTVYKYFTKPPTVIAPRGRESTDNYIVIHPVVSNTGQTPPLVRPGVWNRKNTWAATSKVDKSFMIYMIIFMTVWCGVLLWAMLWNYSTIFHNNSHNVFTLNGLIAFVVAVLVPLGMFYGGVHLAMSKLCEVIGNTRVVATPDGVFTVSYLWTFSHSMFILADEWKFDGTKFVSRQNDNYIDLPVLPPATRESLCEYIQAHWTSR